MKKVILILILFLSCYFIYNKTIDNKIFYLTIGDSLSIGTNGYGIKEKSYNDYIIDILREKDKLKEYNNTFTSNSYEVKDISSILKYNKPKNNEYLGVLIKKADIITISLGMNDIYNNINNNSINIYTCIDTMLEEYDIVLDYIDKFHHSKVLLLGYYNTNGNNSDIFTYANDKLKILSKKYNYNYIDLSKDLNNNPIFFTKKTSFLPNTAGYKKISQIIVENL